MKAGSIRCWVAQPGAPKLGYSNLHHPVIVRKFLSVKQKSQNLYRRSCRPTDTGSVMDFIAGLVVGSVIGFMFAWFLFSWLTAKSESERYSPERLSQGATARRSTSGHDAPGEAAGLP
jgi:hypothetical protein